MTTDRVRKVYRVPEMQGMTTPLSRHLSKSRTAKDRSIMKL